MLGSASQRIRRFPGDKETLKHLYNSPTYTRQIDSNVWYVEREQLYRTVVRGPQHTWGIASRGDVQVDGGTKYIPYWAPNSRELIECIRTRVHDRQGRGEYRNAIVAKGAPRSREEFSRFAMKYQYDEPAIGPVEPKFAAILGDVLVDDTVRVADFLRDRRLLLVEKSTYLDQTATNLVPDEQFPVRLSTTTQAQSFRELDRVNGCLRPFKDCSQANTIGVACTMVDNRNRPLFASRNPTLQAIGEGWHCAASGVLSWSDLLQDRSDESSVHFEGITAGMRREIHEELKLEGDEYTLVMTDFARELPRAGKPQFFFFARLNMSGSEAMELIAERAPEAVGAWERNVDGTMIRKELIHGLRIGTAVTKGLIFDPGITLATVLEGGIDDRVKAFTYEGYASLFYSSQWWAAHDQ